MITRPEYGGVADIEPTLFRNNVLVLAEVGKLYGLSVFRSASFVDDPNISLLAVHEEYPSVEPVYRPGEINVGDNPEIKRR